MLSSVPLEDLLAEIERRFIVRLLSPQIALAAAQLPPTFPSDPFDRIIAATAIVERVPLLTADRNIRRSRAVRTIW
jgi:PIN domain nuclease of toxin-antitoxin system